MGTINNAGTIRRKQASRRAKGVVCSSRRDKNQGHAPGSVGEKSPSHAVTPGCNQQRASGATTHLQYCLIVRTIIDMIVEVPYCRSVEVRSMVRSSAGSSFFFPITNQRAARIKIAAGNSPMICVFYPHPIDLWRCFVFVFCWPHGGRPGRGADAAFGGTSAPDLLRWLRAFRAHAHRARRHARHQRQQADQVRPALEPLMPPGELT